MLSTLSDSKVIRALHAPLSVDWSSSVDYPWGSSEFLVYLQYLNADMIGDMLESSGSDTSECDLS